jgi:Flp pilus assembly secretin CpaC
MAIGDNNLQLASGIDPQVMVPGEVYELSMHVHNGAGHNFSWTNFTPKMRVDVGTLSTTFTGTVVSAGGGTAGFSLTAVQTATFASNAWGRIVLYADPNTGSENLHIATIDLRTTNEVIP